MTKFVFRAGASLLIAACGSPSASSESSSSELRGSGHGSASTTSTASRSSASTSDAGAPRDAAVGDASASTSRSTASTVPEAGTARSSASSSNAASGSSAATHTDGGTSGGTAPTFLPTASGSCPTFANGSKVTLSAGGQTIQADVWMGATGGGPFVFYWHGTGSSPSYEVPVAFDTSALASAGGILVAPEATTRTGTPTGNTGDNVWYQSDVAFMDQALACAMAQVHVDTRHVHSAGYSAGALQTVYAWFARSGYLASVISYSGGDLTINAAPMQDPSHVPAAIVAHGAMGQDVVGADFAQASAAWESVIANAHGTYVDCNDGGNHLAFFQTRAPNLKPVALSFFHDHPFGVAPEPYTTLPAGFPSYCALDAAGQ